MEREIYSARKNKKENERKRMKKEIIIVIVIAIAIIILNNTTNRYTKSSFSYIENQLDEIRQIAMNLNEEKENGRTEQQDELTKKIEFMESEWEKINQKTSFYLEHDELEKVNSSMVKFKSYFELEEYTDAIPELENCKYILKHIQDKESMNPINLF